MPKRIIPTYRIYSEIDDYISYHYTSERDQLQEKGLLHFFIKKWEGIYFSHLKKLKASQLEDDEFLSTDEKQAKYSHLAMLKILDDIREDILFQL